MAVSLRQSTFAILLLLSSPAVAGESLFVFIPRADSPGMTTQESITLRLTSVHTVVTQTQNATHLPTTS